MRGMRRKSDGCTAGVAAAVAVAAVEVSRTASRAAATDDSVAALTVASTNALMEAGSIVNGFVDAVDEKKTSSVGVGEGEGVLSLLALKRA